MSSELATEEGVVGEETWDACEGVETGKHQKAPGRQRINGLFLATLYSWCAANNFANLFAMQVPQF
jgi:hypothetical protein